jgi:outer membrane murein-binding lipoprotein Lpp
MTRLKAAVGAALLLMAGLVAGCTSGQPGDLTVSAERQLTAKVQQVRDIAATGTYAQLTREVRQLQTLVERLHSQGQVTDARFSAIEDAADALLSDAKPKSSPPPSTSSSSRSPSPSPSQTTASSSPTPSQSVSQSQSQSQSPTPTTTISVP